MHKNIYDSNVRVMSKVCGRRKREIRCDQDFYSRCLRYEARFKKYLITNLVYTFQSHEKIFLTSGLKTVTKILSYDTKSQNL